MVVLNTPENSRLQQQDVLDMFRRHLSEHHNITAESDFDIAIIEDHLSGRQTVVPISVFAGGKLSSLEVIVKYLRENEGLTNVKVAELLGRTPASVWITYRNAKKKMEEGLSVTESEVFVPTTVIASGKLSVLESISYYLYSELGFSYKKIALLLSRNERTIWTVCDRARKKLEK